MNKLDLLLDAIDHPERYSPEELSALANDPDTAELYSTLCRTRGTAFASPLSEEDVEKEWIKFRNRNGMRRSPWLSHRLPGRVAIWVCVAIASCSMLAIGISMKMQTKNPAATIDNPEVVQIESSSEAVPDIYTDSTSILTGAIVFEDESLKSIMNRIAPHYGVEVEFKSGMADSVHLFFKWDEEMTLQDVVDQLNTFDRINITLNGNTLTIH